MIWNKNKECMSRDEMHALQSKRLQKLVALVYHNVPFYRNKMQEMDLSPDDIRSIDDIVKRLNGYINRNSEDGAFTTEILIPQV